MGRRRSDPAAYAKQVAAYQAKLPWIKVADRLPTDHVMVRCADHFVTNGRYDPTTKSWHLRDPSHGHPIEWTPYPQGHSTSQ